MLKKKQEQNYCLQPKNTSIAKIKNEQSIKKNQQHRFQNKY